MKILITGSCGFIGYNLCKRILENTKVKIVGIDSLNNYYSINCQKSNLLNGSIKQISQIISIILASSILATI